jgi:hypothetical protein
VLGGPAPKTEERTMTMAIQGGISPEEIIAFIQEHTADCAQQVKGEMQAAQDRTALVKEIADLAAKLEDFKARGDWVLLHTEIENFQKTHEDTWGGHEHDMAIWITQTQLWSEGKTMVDGTFVQKNHPGATDGWSSFTTECVANLEFTDSTKDCAKTIVASWIQELTNWKDALGSDDKIGMMKLQEDADRLKNLYELGSNLISKVDGCASSIIGNIGRA